MSSGGGGGGGGEHTLVSPPPQIKPCFSYSALHIHVVDSLVIFWVLVRAIGAYVT